MYVHGDWRFGWSLTYLIGLFDAGDRGRGTVVFVAENGELGKWGCVCFSG
jgi:hypothetical protein